MKILITGGAGFIGSHIVERYLKDGHEVVVADDLSVGRKENVPAGARFYEVSITDRESIEKIIRDERPEVINHHAAQKNVRVSAEEPAEDARINILGSITLLHMAKKYGVKRFIFASTGGAIYGEADEIPTSEDSLPIPLSPYGIAKFSVENYMRFFADNGGPVPIILRYANVYGPRQDPEGEAGVIAIFIDKLLRGEKPVIYGDGEQTRDFVYVGDVVEVNVMALNEGENGIFNIGTAKETSVNELYNEISIAMGSRVEAQKEAPRAGEVARSCLNSNKAREVLSWVPVVRLDEGLAETVKSMQG